MKLSRPPLVLIVPLVLAALWRFLPTQDEARVIDGATLVVSGDARVVDGDTLVVNGEGIRLFGIDAPEREQVCRNRRGTPYWCGQIAAGRLRKEVKSGKIACTALHHDVYHRRVATCTADGRDLSDAMVRSGWALDYSLYSNGKYLAAETEARNARRGLWEGEFDEPRRWRLEHPRAGWR